MGDRQEREPQVSLSEFHDGRTMDYKYNKINKFWATEYIEIALTLHLHQRKQRLNLVSNGFPNPELKV